MNEPILNPELQQWLDKYPEIIDHIYQLMPSLTEDDSWYNMPDGFSFPGKMISGSRETELDNPLLKDVAGPIA